MRLGSFLLYNYSMIYIILRLDEETEQLHHDRVPLAVGRAIQQGRNTKEWSQKDLATVIIAHLSSKI